MEFKNIKELLRSLIGTKTIVYVNGELDCNGISNFTENDYKFYMNEIEEGELTLQNAIIERKKLYNRLYLYYWSIGGIE